MVTNGAILVTQVGCNLTTQVGLRLTTQACSVQIAITAV